MEESIDRAKLVYKTDTNTFDFRKFNTARTFGKDIYIYIHIYIYIYIMVELLWKKLMKVNQIY